MREIMELLKPVIHVKIVSDSSPDDDGEWVTMSVSHRYLYPKTDFDYLSSLAPSGYHAVAVRE